MKKYKTKLLEIEALQFDGSYYMYQYIIKLFPKEKIELRNNYPSSVNRLIILDRFTNRYYNVNKTDYVVKGALGEIFIYRENLFLEMFEILDEKV